MSKILLLFLSVLGFAAPALAGESAFGQTDHARMRLLTAVDSIAPDTAEFEAALHMEMGEGWHSYWRRPGDAGAPPRFDWSASENVKDVQITWQAPRRFDEAGFQTFGYADDVYFPLVVQLHDPGAPAKLNVSVQTMVCKDICIPQQFSMGVSIPTGEGGDAAQKKIIEFEKQRVPVSEDAKGLSIDSIVAGKGALVINVTAQGGFEHGDVFAYGPELTFTAIPEISHDQDDPHKAMVVIKAPDDIEDLTAHLSGKELSVTVVNGRSALEKIAKF